MAASSHVEACTPQAGKPCSCPSASWRKESGVSDRDFCDLMHRGTYMSEARIHSDRWADKWQDMASGEGLGKFTILGGIDSRLDNQLVTGKPTKGYTSHCSFDKLSCWRCSNLRFQTITRWGRASM